MKKILIVDDEIDVAQRIGRSLISKGYEVILAFSGEQGLIEAVSTQPDLMILDATMPNMSGLEVLRHLRDEPFLDNVPIMLLVTRSSAEEAIINKGIASIGKSQIKHPEILTVDTFQHKPIVFIELHTYVRAIFRSLNGEFGPIYPWDG